MTEKIFKDIDEKLVSGDPFEPELQRLMEFKVRKVLLVASLWDYFMLEEDGRLIDLLGEAYKEYDLGYVPLLHRVDGGKAALEEIENDEFDLVITVMRIKDMEPYKLAQRIKRIQSDLPVVLLAYNTPELEVMIQREENRVFERIFVWQGDGNILIGIIKSIEDQRNAENDTELAGVQHILLIEDSIHFYSKYLYILYEELWLKIRHLLRENISYTLRKSRQRKRPRILHAINFEEGLDYYNKYKPYLLGIITDVEYPREGKKYSKAGIEFSAMVRKDFPDMPLLIQSSDRTNKIDAKKLGAGFLDKRSPTLAQDFRKILNEVFYFGDYRVTNGKNPNVYKIKSLSSLVDTFTELPADVVVENIRNGQLCRWLRARTDIKLANGLSELNTAGADIETTKIQIIELIKKYRKWNHRGSITAYSPKYFKDYSNFSKIGGGSIGGKARGLAFIDKSLAAYFNVNKYPGINVSIPATLVLATDLFDSFINDNDLLEFAAKPDLTNQQVVDRFIQYNLPEEALEPIREFIQQIKVPLAVRSSSVLEDSLYQPFAGIYATIMLPNDHPDEEVRYNNLLYAVKCLYASTFFREPKSYIKNTNYHIEDEKMAVVIQEVVGKRRGDRFYPDFSGVARSYNYYPFGGSKAEEGVVSLATGLGKIIVDGGQSITYSPANPMVLPQYNTVDDYLKNSQHEMWAIQMGLDEFIDINNEEQYLTKVDLKTAEEDGVLLYTGSTYIPENHQIYDGISRYGPRVITFAHILKNNVFPLNDLIKDLLKIGEHAVGAPVEIEFSVTLGNDSPYPANFGFLQVRPCTGKGELIEVQFDRFTEASVFCQSDQILGNGEITDIKDILFVKPDKFDPAKTPLIANEIGEFNKKLKKKLSPYLLAGPGRWGSSESWLGIPVQWDQIDNAKVMIETSHSKMSPDPSQGSHFFHNITSLRIGYFTIPPKSKTSMIDWDWLRRQPFVEETDYVRHVRFDSGFMIKMDGRTGKGVILKPGIMGVMSRMFPI